MKNLVVNVLVGFAKVLFHVFGLCTCCKKEKEVIKNEAKENES